MYAVDSRSISLVILPWVVAISTGDGFGHRWLREVDDNEQ